MSNLKNGAVAAFWLITVSAWTLFFVAPKANAKVELPDVFSSHMVLQCGMPVPIWGKANRREKITVQFRDQTKSTVADAAGHWSLKLDPLEAGGPDILTVTGADIVTFEDVLVGEVWLGSGQSNMNHFPSLCFKDADELHQPRDTKLEQDVAQTWPQVRLLRRPPRPQSWELATPETTLKFSALLLEFGIQLQAELKVPVGLIVGAEGGTTSGVWIPRDAFDKDEAVQKAVLADSPKLEAKRLKAQAELAKWKQTPAATNPAAVPPVRVPIRPAELAAIGQNYRRFVVPNRPFAIRGVLWDQGESDTGIEGVDQYTLMGALIAGWRKDWGQGDFPWIYIQKPSGWGCALNPKDPVTARAVPFAPLPAQIPTTKWHDGRRRVMYDRIREYPNTAMACVSDLGVGLHPLDKSAYAARAVRAALALAYHQPIEIYGPSFRSMDLEDGKARIHYAHVDKGLAVPAGKPLQGFTIAGEDKVWHWADAKLDGETVLVSSPKVAKPVAVRYAWAERIPWATLFSQNGLPALPFRTDDWVD